MLPSVIDVWPAANWFEREAFDLFGFEFTGHPNLRRLLCHDAFVGHALRKDYAAGAALVLREKSDLRWPDWATDTDERAGHFETQTISIGPSHPATHGIVHLLARLDGERIIARRDPDRLPPPLLREDGRDAHLEPGDPLHRPAELRARR